VKFAIVVQEGPHQHQAADSAYEFTLAALAAGHEIVRVFFYHDGVHNGTRLAVPPQDEQKTAQRWDRLGRERGVDLVLCVAAAQRRGLMDADEARRHGKDAHNMASGFRISGLGQLVDAAIEADRTVVFGD
jgi:tRNA 2-thiouridine synthesizing protein D